MSDTIEFIEVTTNTTSIPPNDDKCGKKIEFRNNSINSEVEKILCPDENGVSAWIPIEVFEEAGYPFGNGGSWARSDGRLASKYIIEKDRSSGTGNKITSIRTVGFATKINSRSPIPLKAREELKGKPCPVCGRSHGKNELDHKNGHDRTGDSVDDFQPLCKPCNDQKRHYCKECRDTGKRFDATRLSYKVGWLEGNSFYTTAQGCKGCYWYDVALFHKTAIFKK